MAKPRAKLPERSVTVFCSKCKSKLLLYKKNGNGALVKCFVERIVKDYTTEQGTCPSCNSQFARSAMIRGAPALKIMGGKVITK